MRLVSVDAELFVPKGSMRAQPIRFRLSFSDGRSLRLSGDGTGETLRVDAEPLEPTVDMGRYGETFYQDVICLLSPYLMDTPVERLTMLELAGVQVGFSLVPTAGQAFHIWVDGDEFYWGNDSALAEHPWRNGAAPTQTKFVWMNDK